MNVFLSLLRSKLNPISLACFLRSSSLISLLHFLLNQTNRTADADKKLKSEKEPQKTAKFSANFTKHLTQFSLTQTLKFEKALKCLF